MLLHWEDMNDKLRIATVDSMFRVEKFENGRWKFYDTVTHISDDYEKVRKEYMFVVCHTLRREFESTFLTSTDLQKWVNVDADRAIR